MVSDITRPGLIVSPTRRASDLLDELIAYTEWPVLVEPSVRLLLQQIEVTSPQCLLFWFDETQDIDSGLKLIARLRDRGSRPYRVAVVYRLPTDAEPAIRSAGIHSVLNVCGSIEALVRSALLPLLAAPPSGLPAVVGREQLEPVIRGPTSARGSPAKLHPP